LMISAQIKNRLRKSKEHRAGSGEPEFLLPAPSSQLRAVHVSKHPALTCAIPSKLGGTENPLSALRVKKEVPGRAAGGRQTAGDPGRGTVALVASGEGAVENQDVSKPGASAPRLIRSAGTR
jgi:hypothetical protein